jgi:hypothetical protein
MKKIKILIQFIIIFCYISCFLMFWQFILCKEYFYLIAGTILLSLGLSLTFIKIK